MRPGGRPSPRAATGGRGAVQLLRVDRVDCEAALRQVLDHRPARRLDHHARQRGVPGERQQPVRHLRQPGAAVLERPFPESLPGRVQDARLVHERAIEAGAIRRASFWEGCLKAQAVARLREMGEALEDGAKARAARELCRSTT